MSLPAKDMNPAHVALAYPLRCLLAGVRFLTILPTFSSARDDSDYLAGSLYFFPIIGVFLGGIAGFLGWLLLFFMPGALGAALMAVCLAFFSGFLHLDGLADTCDGFLSGKPADSCLTIMRDSRIGVMGAVGICSVLLIKAVALGSLAEPDFICALIIAPIAGRIAIICMMSFLPYARGDNGLATLFYRGSTRVIALVSVLFFLLVIFLISPDRLLIIIPMTGLVIFGFSLICRKKIGGATGDTLGAVCELSELGVLIAFTLYLN